MIIEFNDYMFALLATSSELLIVLAIFMLALTILREIYGIYHDVKFDRMIKRTDKDIEELAQKRLKELRRRK